MKNFLLVAFSFILLIGSYSLSMHNIKLGDSENVLEKINLKKLGYEELEGMKMTRFLTKNGNHLSVTIDNKKVVYLENDFIDRVNGEKPLVTNFIFGKSSLNEIRAKFNSNGFIYNNRLYSETDTSLIAFNCYELKSIKKEIIVFVTAIPLAETPSTLQELGDLMKLDAIIISNEAFLDKIWGENKSFDENYTPIELGLLN